MAELEDAAARAERDEMIGFMSWRIEDEGLGGREREVYGKKSGFKKKKMKWWGPLLGAWKKRSRHL